MLCEYGCGNIAKFKLKSGKSCCSKSYQSCDANRKKNSQSLKNGYKEGKILSRSYVYDNLPEETKNKMAWNRGQTKETNDSIKKGGKTLSNKIKSGEIKASFQDKKHSIESKQKISKKASENNNGYVKTKYYSVFCKFKNKDIKVQGSFEYKFAEYLNENNILWIKEKSINLKYKLFEEDYIHTYYPDFYLPESNEYIEIKGHWWKSSDGRVDDRRKMKKILECNSDKKITILEKQDLLKLGIEI